MREDRGTGTEDRQFSVPVRGRRIDNFKYAGVSKDR
jgi:hypothetical protein